MIKRCLRLFRRSVRVVMGREVWLRPTIIAETEFHGSSYGGWAVQSKSLSKRSIVISAGIGEDASFDIDLINTYRCRIWALDPTERTAEWVAANVAVPEFRFHQTALAATDGLLEMFPPVEIAHVSASCRRSQHTRANSYQVPCVRLSTFMDREGISHIDVLKMDIEGAEYGVIDDLVVSGTHKQISQLLVEFHHHFSGFSVKETEATVAQLRKAGFQIAWVSEAGYEVLFVRTGPGLGISSDR
jgi:FkbM family methyltransferase